MKNITVKAVSALLALVTFSSCMNTYDAYGRPVQSVDPNAALGAAAVAGVAGYAIGKNNGKKTYVAPGYYGRPGYGRPGYGGRPGYWRNNHYYYY